jgi:hypothetical protein
VDFRVRGLLELYSPAAIANVIRTKRFAAHINCELARIFVVVRGFELGMPFVVSEFLETSAFPNSINDDLHAYVPKRVGVAVQGVYVKRMAQSGIPREMDGVLTYQG